MEDSTKVFMVGAAIFSASVVVIAGSVFRMDWGKALELGIWTVFAATGAFIMRLGFDA